MVTDEMVENAERVYWDTSNDPEGARDMRAALEAALSAAEPVAWRWRSTLFAEWNLSDNPPVDQKSMERLTELNMEGLEWQALYAEPVKTAPAVEDHAKLLSQVASIICEETCGLTSQCKSREAAKALYEKGYLTALSAQVQDVAAKSLADAYQKYLDASDLYNERLAISKTKALGTMRVDEEYRAIDDARRAFDKLAIDIAKSALPAAPAKQEGGESQPVHKHPVENGESGDK